MCDVFKSRNDTHFVNPGAAIGATPDTEEAMFTGESQAVSNMYSKMHGSRKKHRAPKSPYLRAMSRHMVIKHEQLTLLQHIGQGSVSLPIEAETACIQQLWLVIIIGWYIIRFSLSVQQENLA